MGVTRTLLEAGILSANAQKALVAGPAKMMVARGLIPIANPSDLLSVFYQLSLDGDNAVREAANQSVSVLPDTVLHGALGDTSLDPRVLDYFSETLRDKPDLQQRIVLNAATADQTIADLVAQAEPMLVDLISQNEERLLRHPEIIGAMYTNAKARMSTVDRAVELAVRNNLTVPGISAWDEVRKAVLGQSNECKGEIVEADEMFDKVANALLKPTEDSEIEALDEEKENAAVEDLPINKMTIPMKIRLATLGNAFARAGTGPGPD